MQSKLQALTPIVLNRSGHYNRALEEAIQTHKSQWAKDWEAKNPLSGGATFSSMSPTERVKISIKLISNLLTVLSSLPFCEPLSTGPCPHPTLSRA